MRFSVNNINQWDRH